MTPLSHFILCILLCLPWLKSRLGEDLSFGGLSPFLLLTFLFLSYYKFIKGRSSIERIPQKIILICFSLYFNFAGLTDFAVICACMSFIVGHFHQSRHWIGLLALSIIVIPFTGYGFNEFCRTASLKCLSICISPFDSITLVGKSCFIGDESIRILESCSGATITKLTCLLCSTLFWLNPIRCHGYLLLFSLPLGIVLNTIRLCINLVVVWFGSSETLIHLEQTIGAILFIGFFYCLIRWISLKNINIPTLKLSCLLPFVLLFVFSIINSSKYPRQVQHHFQLVPISEHSYLEHHKFIEKNKELDWYLLNHPIEACLRIKGWDLDQSRGHSNLNGKIKKVQVKYRIGPVECSNRFQVIWKLCTQPNLWSQSLTVEAQLYDVILKTL